MDRPFHCSTVNVAHTSLMEDRLRKIPLAENNPTPDQPPQMAKEFAEGYWIQIP